MDEKDENGNLACSKKHCEGVEVPTKDELVALNALREIKNRVRDIKTMLSELSPIDNKVEEILELEEEMKRLRAEWEEWEKRKEEAARQRMILLGHEEES